MSCDSITVVIDASDPVEAVVLVEEFGPPGSSAYDVWLAQPGNAGRSAAEFLESLRGPAGVTPISDDPENRLTTGGDGGLFVPDIQVDPLAYYILAKA